MRHTFIAFKTNMLLKYITIGMERRPNNIHQNVNILYQIFNGKNYREYIFCFVLPFQFLSL